jgi:hypothetical protein
MPVKKRNIRKKKKGNKHYQKQKQSVNVNIKIDQSKKVKSHSKNIPEKQQAYLQPSFTMYNAHPAEQPNYKLLDMNQITPVSEPKFIKSKIPIHFVDRNEQVNMMMPTQSIFTQTDRLTLPKKFTVDEYDLEDESFDESMSSPTRDINQELVLEQVKQEKRTPVTEPRNFEKPTKSSISKSLVKHELQTRNDDNSPQVFNPSTGVFIGIGKRTYNNQVREGVIIPENGKYYTYKKI